MPIRFMSSLVGAKSRMALIALLATLSAATPALAAPITFALVGDFGVPGSTAAQNVANMVSGWNPDFVIGLGDLNYGTLGNGVDNFGQWSTATGAYYGQYMKRRVGDARYAEQTNTGAQRFYPVVGNHDTGGPGADSVTGGSLAGYLDYFHNDPGDPNGRLPTGTGVHSAQHSFYDFTVGNTRFFAVDSDHAKIDAASMTAQKNWLQTQLAASTADWNIVLTHHPPFSSGSGHGSDPQMQWDFQAWGADAVFSGHEHIYERLVIGNLPYFVNGTGGQTLTGFNTPVSGSMVRNNANSGAMKVTIDGSLATFQYYTITSGGTLIDSFTVDQSLPAPITKSFRQDVGGYVGARDTYVAINSPNTSFATASPVIVDGDIGGSAGQPAQGLIKFTDLFGAGIDQIPEGATIVSATLQITTGSASNDQSATVVKFHRMLTNWNDTDTWNSLTAGISANGTEAALVADGQLTPNTLGGTVTLDVTATLQAWANDPSSNFGWAILPDGTDGWRFNSADFGTITSRPLLTIMYQAVPEPSTYALGLLGLFGLGAVAWGKRRRAA